MEKDSTHPERGHELGLLSERWQQAHDGQGHGQRDAAHRLLADTYAWFTEGFATADLKAARTLLAALQ